MSVFDQYHGRVPKDLRKQAEQATGLTWLQIYKWIFDRKQRKKEYSVYRLLNYPVPIFRVTDKHGRDLTEKRPIFTVERHARPAMRASGKPDVC